MLYPLKFMPVYKEMVWGGRNLEKLGKTLPEGNIGESWEISCHPDGVNVIANGEYKGMLLTECIAKLGRKAIGTSLPEKDVEKFPLLVKIIDANDKLSVQVHPDDVYAQQHENGEYGKNEMWYILSAAPGAKLVYDVMPGVTREKLCKALERDEVEACLKYVEVKPGDVLNIPAGLVHAIGEGIVLAEVQQNSNTTYRVYDYNRVDKNGNKRALHIEKALDVIDFQTEGRKEMVPGLKVPIHAASYKTYKVANRYFSVELYEVSGEIKEDADGSKFCLYVVLEGEMNIQYAGGAVEVQLGESVLIPASMGAYTLEGSFKALKSYVPDLDGDIMEPLRQAGYTETQIMENVAGLRQK